MQFHLDQPEGMNRVGSYVDGKIWVNQAAFEVPVLVSAAHIVTDNLPASLAELAPHHLASFEPVNAEIWLVGTGASSLFLSLEQELWIAQQQRYFDCMSTAAACRTYAVLLAEKRSVAALLFP